MNNLKFNLANLAVSDLDCNDRQIFVGSTSTAPWGYVLKLISIDSAAKEAVIEILYYGDSVDIILMKYGDVWSLTDPNNSEGRYDHILKSVFEGGELNIAVFNVCTYTKQYTTLTMIADLPVSIVDGQSYTVTGRLTKDRLNEILETPITNEKVYITESGTKIVESLTNSDGMFSLTFTYHENNNYEIYYPGTVDVTAFYYILNATIIPGSTHTLTYTFETYIPDAAITAFNTISDPINEINKILTEQGLIGNLAGWELKNVQLNKKQVIIYLRDVSSLSSSLKYSTSINTLDVWLDIITTTIIAGVIGVILGIIFAVTFPFSLAVGLFVGTVVAILSNWKAVFRSITGIEIGEITKEPTTSDIDEDVNKHIETLDVNCKKTYDICIITEDIKTCCLTYCDCLLNNGYVTIAGTKAYLHPDAGIDLRALAEQLKNGAKNECIFKLEKDEISCDEAIECIKKRVSDAMISSTNIVYNYYPPNDPYIAPWEKDENGGLSELFGSVLFYGGLALAGYIGYKMLKK